MKNLPGVFILVIGMVLGAGAYALVQFATHSQTQPQVENLQLQIQMMELRTHQLQKKITEQDSLMGDFQKILRYLPDSASN